ncbi:hypothetical protein C7212DRAFT_153698 [Tuber magnatum]|uniref:Cora-domain-containing protein n=1 Tax=Tuber magnatum TaxID=42249 RepID=A0A317SXD7_9PEZI|nr:hypothetical protein C7212DRAFT_152963 [Tuber magnatum]PWW79098.1 hypothetical protein C7212DRAFT_153698 [Tuber magnatum]
MANPATKFTAPPDPTPGPSPGSIGQSPQLPPTPPVPSVDWEIIKHKGFYDEQDCLHPSRNLSSEKLKGRKEHVVIFNYSLFPDFLSPEDGGGDGKGGGPSSGHSPSEDDKFVQVSHTGLIESKQFEQIINPTGKPRCLGIIDFPQCYDTSDSGLLQSIADKLFPREIATAFAVSHKDKVLSLPGQACFRTGILLRAPFKKQSGLSKSDSPEDRFMLFVSFPYLGNYSTGVQPGPDSESARLLEFKREGDNVPDHDVKIEEKGNYLGEILVHQARYMIFDNHTMATFRSKEDSAKDQAPLHLLQARIGAFCATIHMMANRMDSELVTAERLQASLRKLEEDLDQIISGTGTHERDLETNDTPKDPSVGQAPHRGAISTPGEPRRGGDYQQNYFQRNQRRALLTSLNRHSAALFSVIMVAERQIELLHDLHRVFSTIYPARTQDHGGNQSPKNRPYQNIFPRPILLESPGEIQSNSLDTIDELIRERILFIKKIKVLVKNIDNRRSIFFGFLGSEDGGKVEGTLGRQAQTLSGFTVVTAAFLPLNFFASYFANNNIKDFSKSPITKRYFWLVTGPVCGGVILLTVVIMFWERLAGGTCTTYLREKLDLPRKWTIGGMGVRWPGSGPSEELPIAAPRREVGEPVLSEIIEPSWL